MAALKKEENVLLYVCILMVCTPFADVWLYFLAFLLNFFCVKALLLVLCYCFICFIFYVCVMLVM